MGRVKTKLAKNKRPESSESRAHKQPKRGLGEEVVQHFQLDSLLPRAGMIYPFKRGIMRQQMGDTRIVLALAKSRAIQPRHLMKPLVERWAADLFSGARKFLESPLAPQFICRPPALVSAVATLGAAAQIDAGSGASFAPLSFLCTLRGWLLGAHTPTTGPDEWDGDFDWLEHVSFNMFAALFLLLRSARLRWYKNPRLPLDVAEHSVLPQAIDQFNKVAERVEWGGMEMVLWLRDGAMWLDPRENDEGKGGKGKEKGKGKGKGKGPAVAKGDNDVPVPDTGGAHRLKMGELRELMELLSINCTWDMDVEMTDI